MVSSWAITVACCSSISAIRRSINSVEYGSFGVLCFFTVPTGGLWLVLSRSVLSSSDVDSIDVSYATYIVFYLSYPAMYIDVYDFVLQDSQL